MAINGELCGEWEKVKKERASIYQLNDRGQSVCGELREFDGLFFLSQWKSSTLNTAIADEGRKSNKV